MTDAHIGRLLAATLHQAIAEVLPMRVDFYGHWLSGEGLRDGAIGLAPMTAVLGFLRAEGGVYHTVMSAAGRLAADWSIDSMSSMKRGLIRALPRPLRARAAVGVARTIARAGYGPSKVSVKRRRGTIRFRVRDSLFCRVRETQKLPLCTYYEALVVRVLERFNLGVESAIERCRASGGADCVIAITFTAAVRVTEPALAA